jgi:hypothetical protein
MPGWKGCAGDGAVEDALSPKLQIHVSEPGDTSVPLGELTVA